MSSTALSIISSVALLVAVAIGYVSAKLFDSIIGDLVQTNQLGSRITKIGKYIIQTKSFWAIAGLVVGGALVAIAVAYIPLNQMQYVNHLHSERAKWQFANHLVLSYPPVTDCSVTITRLEQKYAEDYAADFKSILELIKWKYTERFADKTIPDGVAFRAISTPGLPYIKSQQCANLLNLSYQNSALRPNGQSVDSDSHLFNYQESEAPDYLTKCTSACVEVTFGNEDTSH